MDFITLSHTHTLFKTYKKKKKLLIALRTIPNAMFYSSGCGLPLHLASPLHTPAPLAVLVVFQYQVLPAPGPLHLPFPLSGTIFPIHFHLDNSSHPSSLHQCQLLGNEFTLPDEAFSHSDLSYFSSTLSFSSVERN